MNPRKDDLSLFRSKYEAGSEIFSPAYKHPRMRLSVGGVNSFMQACGWQNTVSLMTVGTSTPGAPFTYVARERIVRRKRVGQRRMIQREAIGPISHVKVTSLNYEHFRPPKRAC